MFRQESLQQRVRTWRIFQCDEQRTFVGVVEAADRDTAIQRAIQQLRITQGRCSTLVAEPQI
jgi:hypothetical protein